MLRELGLLIGLAFLLGVLVGAQASSNPRGEVENPAPIKEEVYNDGLYITDQ